MWPTLVQVKTTPLSTPITAPSGSFGPNHPFAPTGCNRSQVLPAVLNNYAFMNPSLTYSEHHHFKHTLTSLASQPSTSPQQISPVDLIRVTASHSHTMLLTRVKIAVRSLMHACRLMIGSYKTFAILTCIMFSSTNNKARYYMWRSNNLRCNPNYRDFSLIHFPNKKLTWIWYQYGEIQGECFKRT